MKTLSFVTALVLLISSNFAHATIGLGCGVDSDSPELGSYTGFYADTYYPTGTGVYYPRIHTLWFEGNDLLSPDKENSKVSVAVKEVNCAKADGCTIYAKLDINGNGKYEGEFVVTLDKELAFANVEEAGVVYTGVYIDYTKKDKGIVTKSAATCSISN